VHQQKATKLI